MSSNILVPEVGESIVDARVAKWLRKEGEAVAAGDPLVELETDKIDVEVSAPHAGVLSRIDRKDGEDVKVGEVLGDSRRVGARSTGSGREGRRDAGAGRRRGDERRRRANAAGDADGPEGGGGERGRSLPRARQRRRRARDAPGCRAGGRRRGAAARRVTREGEARSSGRRGAPARGRGSHRRARPHVQAPRDDCPPAGRGAEHGGDAQHVQ